MHNSTTELFEIYAGKVIETTNIKSENRRIVFLKSWNEWAEGNYMEPDLRWGHAFLDALRNEVVD